MNFLLPDDGAERVGVNDPAAGHPPGPVVAITLGEMGVVP